MQAGYKEEQGRRSGHCEDSQSTETERRYGAAKRNHTVGKVTQVQPKSSGGATLAIIFDQLETTKGAAPMAVHGLLAAVAPAPASPMPAARPTIFPWGGRRHQGTDGQSDRHQLRRRRSSTAADPAGSGIKGVVLSPIPAADGSTFCSRRIKTSSWRMERGLRLG